MYKEEPLPFVKKMGDARSYIWCLPKKSCIEGGTHRVCFLAVASPVSAKDELRWMDMAAAPLKVQRVVMSVVTYKYLFVFLFVVLFH